MYEFQRWRDDKCLRQNSNRRKVVADFLGCYPLTSKKAVDELDEHACSL